MLRETVIGMPVPGPFFLGSATRTLRPRKGQHYPVRVAEALLRADTAHSLATRWVGSDHERFGGLGIINGTSRLYAR